MKKILAIIAGIAIGLLPVLVYAASPPVFDTSANGSGTNPSKAITPTAGGQNVEGLVFLTPFAGTDTSSSCTWAGGAMTQVADTNSDPVSGTSAHYYIYAFAATTTGNVQTASCSTSGNYGIILETYTNVNQATPFDTNFDGSSHTFVQNSGLVVAPNQITATGTTHVDQSIGVAQANNSGAGSATVGTNSTARVTSNGTVWESTVAKTPSGSMSMGVESPSGSQTVWIYIAALQPVAAAAAVNPLSSQLLLFGDW